MGFRHRSGSLSPFTALAVALGFALLLAAAAALAALPPYGNHGQVVTAFRGSQMRVAGIAGYGDGKMLVAGTVTSGVGTSTRKDDDEDFLVARYLAGGRLDPSFGEGGIVRTDLGSDEQATDIKVDPFGQILVSGYEDLFPREVRDQEALVARYTGAGQLDRSFGDGGIARAGKGGALAVAFDRSNHVLLAGGTALDAADTENPWRIVRLTHAGALDSSFGGGDGEVTGFAGGQSNLATDLTTDPQGRVDFAVCGQSAQAPPVFTVGRLGSDGSLDGSFNEGGTLRISLEGAPACPHAISRDQQGRIVIAGNAKHRLVVGRLLEDGTLDPSYGKGGIASPLYSRSNVRLGRLAIDGRNRVVLAGRIAPTFRQILRGSHYPARMLLTRLRADGRLDRRFGGDGSVAVHFGKDKACDAQAADVAIFESVVYAAGTVLPHRSSCPPPRLALTRYPPGPPR
jgi:uncharacterized delta-60 repeat protein